MWYVYKFEKLIFLAEAKFFGAFSVELSKKKSKIIFYLILRILKWSHKNIIKLKKILCNICNIRLIVHLLKRGDAIVSLAASSILVKNSFEPSCSFMLKINIYQTHPNFVVLNNELTEQNEHHHRVPARHAAITFYHKLLKSHFKLNLNNKLYYIWNPKWYCAKTTVF